VWIASRLTGGDSFWMSMSALAVMAGHAYPVFLKFKGGKAVASFVGAFLCLTPFALLSVLAVFVAAVAWTRYISAGSVIGAATFPLAVWLIEKPPLAVFAASLIAGAFIIYRHASNIKRLREGSEHVFTLGDRKHV
jgi:acyl phosphate:glycerol-3-phosphate acyltransferase